MNYFPVSADLSEYCNNPYRMLSGEIPYVDFWLLFTPGEVYLPAFIYQIFGLDIDILLLATLIINIIFSFIAFYIGKYLTGRNTGAILFTLAYFYTGVIFNYIGPEYLHLYYSFILISLYYLARFLRDEKYICLFLSGAMLAIAFFFRFYESGAAALAFLIVLIYNRIQNKRRFKKILANVVWYLAGVIITGAILLIPFYDILPLIFREAVLESLQNGTSMELPYFWNFNIIIRQASIHFCDLLSGFSSLTLFKLIYNVVLFPSLLFYYISVPVIVIFAMFYVRKSPGRIDLSIFMLFILWGLFSFIKGIGRSDTPHLALSAAPFVMALVYIAYNIKQAEHTSRFRLYAKITAYLVVIPMMFVSFTRFIEFHAFPRTVVETESGRVFMWEKEKAVALKNIIETINNKSRKGDYIFATPWDFPPIYALTERKNPTYYDSLNDLVIRSSVKKQEKLIRNLISHDTKLIIHDSNWGYDNKPEQQFKVACSMLQQFFETECIKVAQFGQWEIYELGED